MDPVTPLALARHAPPPDLAERPGGRLRRLLKVFPAERTTPVLPLMIGLGGMAGAYARYRVSGWVHGRAGGAFPWGTLAVNLSGSFVLGLLLPLLEAVAPLAPIHAFVTIGCIGAFTTFSTFAYEAFTLLEAGRRALAGAYVAASLGLGLLCIAAGLAVGRLVL